MPFPTKAANNTKRLPWTIGLGIALLLGIVFRLVWTNDIEYKLDETYTFTKTKRFVEGMDAKVPVIAAVTVQTLDSKVSSPWLGMPTSKGFYNPGLSLWSFYGVGVVTGTGTPPDLARGVQLCNVAAIVLLLAFAWRAFEGREREWWLWTVALVCVNPFTVLIERKIWPPSLLPLLMVLFLMGWRSRSQMLGAFAWGLIGAVAGQLHMAGFFYAACFFGWTVLYDRRRVAWGCWIGGNLLGAVPMLPWFQYMLTSPHQTNAGVLAWWRPFTSRYWIDWATEPFGLGLDYSLGNDFHDFLAQPLVGGHATYGAAIVHGIAVALCAGVLVPAFLRWWKNRAQWRAQWREGQAVFTSATLQAGFWFYGVLLAITCLRFERHYLVVTFPLLLLWAARLALPFDATERQWRMGRRMLVGICAANALITFLFLNYIHVNGGAPHGDYQRSYSNQVANGTEGYPSGTVWTDQK